jgi:hypothetical protein
MMAAAFAENWFDTTPPPESPDDDRTAEAVEGRCCLWDGTTATRSKWYRGAGAASAHAPPLRRTFELIHSVVSEFRMRFPDA